MKLKKLVTSAIAAMLIFSATSSMAGHALVASGEASEDMAEAALHLASATGNLSAAGIYLSTDTAIAIGKPVGRVILETAELSGETLEFSGDVLAQGLITTAKLSSDLVLAGVDISADTAIFIGQAANAGIHLSTDTAQTFLDQAVNIAVASGRLSGESAKLALVLTEAGVELSADTTILVTNAGKAGIHISREAARDLIDASLEMADECIQATVLAERYVLMTLADANELIKEASVATVRAGMRGGKQVYFFSTKTTGYLRDLGIDSAKYAKELTIQAAMATSATVINSIKGANDTVVVVINTGSGLVVATLDSLTTSVENVAQNIR